MKKRWFTEEELRHYNGRGGAPAFVAYRGRVYDVSESSLWRDGRHQARHYAGADLTSGMDQAPHGSDFLERFPIVGTLGNDFD